MAFVSTTPVLARSTAPMAKTSFVSRRSAAVAPARRSATVVMMADKPKIEKIPQGFTGFSEQLNGRAAMMGFLLAVVTEAITGKGIIGQVGTIFDIVNSAAAGN